MKSRFVWFLFGLLAVSCAIPEPPPGGPEDKTAPEVVTTSPKNGSTGVAADAKIEIEFGEKMSAARMDRLVEISPPAKVAKARWKGSTVVIELDAPLHADTTYVIRLKPGFADAHGVRSTAAFQLAFATSADIDTGSIAGRVYYRRKPTGKGIVRLFVLPRDSSFTPETGRPDREASTGEDGVYELRYLPARGVPFLLWAFNDDSGDGAFQPEKEAGALFPDTLVLTVGRPRLELQDIYVVDPREPAVIAGTAINATPYDTIPVSLSLHEASDTIPPTYFARADRKGRYSFDKVLKGTYTLNAFIDLKKDSLCGSYPCPEDSARDCAEFCATYPDSIVVSPGDNIQLKPIRLEASGKKEGE